MGALNIFRLLGDFVHVASIFLLSSKIYSSRSCRGISLKSQLLYLAVFVLRYLDLFAMLRFDILHLYNFIMKVLFISSQAAIIYLMNVRFSSTLDKRTDSFRRNWIYLILGLSFVLALFTTTTHTSWPFFVRMREYLWTFSILLESVAILPQLYMMQRTGEAESITTHYLILLGLYRALYLLNWIYRWLIRDHTEGIAVLAGLLQTALYSDLFYVYFTRVSQNRPYKLPL